MKGFFRSLVWPLGIALMLAGCSGAVIPTKAPSPDVAPLATERGEEQHQPTEAPTNLPPTATQPRPTFVPLPSPSATATGTLPTAADVLRIGVIGARARVEAGSAILVDVRTEATYNSAHIEGALSMPVDQVGQRYAELPEDKLVIFYCA